MPNDIVEAPYTGDRKIRDYLLWRTIVKCSKSRVWLGLKLSPEAENVTDIDWNTLVETDFHKIQNYVISFHAIKQISISRVNSPKHAEHLWNERHVLEEIQNDPLVQQSCHILYECFKTDDSLYFVLELVSGGPLNRHIRYNKGLPEATVRWYAAELVHSLTNLHARGWIHRDIQASNVLLSHTGRIILVDFGFAKKLTPNDQYRTFTFCGTIHAMAPEIFRNETQASNGYGFPVDWWALGVLIFEMFTSTVPFGYCESDDHSTLKDLTLKSPSSIEFPESIPPEAQDLISKLLEADENQRLGSKTDGCDVMEHPFFSGIDWEFFNTITDNLSNNEKANYIRVAHEYVPSFEKSLSIPIPVFDDEEDPFHDF